MKTQENASGKPLADALWLENHHRAKLPERTAFAQKLAMCWLFFATLYSLLQECYCRIDFCIC